MSPQDSLTDLNDKEPVPQNRAAAPEMEEKQSADTDISAENIDLHPAENPETPVQAAPPNEMLGPDASPDDLTLPDERSNLHRSESGELLGTDASPDDLTQPEQDAQETKPFSTENSSSTQTETAEEAPDERLSEKEDEVNEEAPMPEHQADVDTQSSTPAPSQEKVLSEIDPEKTDEGAPQAEKFDQKAEAENPSDEQNPETKLSSQPIKNEDQPNAADAREKLEEERRGPAPESHLSLDDVLRGMENIINKPEAGAFFREFNLLRDQANILMAQETEAEKKAFSEQGNEADDFKYTHPAQQKLSGLIHVFREKNEEYARSQEESHSKNLEERQAIIEKLKNLYTNTEAGTNLFKAIRTIKEEWKNAGQVAKSEFKLLNNNYFHHLNQFYEMLDMNKEYMEQEYAHNLEKRRHIISRAKELEAEPAVQKALNELQYLHKLWKEEAEPVAEEFREKTWEEFKEISNRIHDRKSELSAQIEEEQTQNLERKNNIIAEIRKIAAPEKEPNHNYWQNSIKKIEELRSEFLKLGSVPRKVSNQNWNDFKQELRNFNTRKNEFYKGLKNAQQTNLEEKQKLVAAAKDNMLSEDWETVVPLFKKLQEDWKNIGHVPRSMTQKIWEEFRQACNTFFNNYREKNNATDDNWKENYKRKRKLLEELKEVTEDESSVEKIENIKSSWNSIGKVPREKIAINTEFNKILREKLKLNKIEGYALKEEGLSENQVTDKARKIKNQISDLEAEIVKMENNLGFFSNSSRENPLLRETYERIDAKKRQLEEMKKSLHNIVTGENQ